MAERATTASTKDSAKDEGSKSPRKSKDEETLIYKFFQVKDSTINRLRKECPRCGRGVYLAEHKDRLTCGKCAYTSYKKHA